MKRFIVKSVCFALFFIVFSIIINSLFLAIIAQSDWDFVKRLETLKFRNPDYKVLIFGTSLAEYGIDAELLTKKGISSYNFAFVGSSVKTNYVQLNEYLENYSIKPKLVILALNSSLERFDQEGIQPVVEFTMKGHKYGIKDVPISKFRWAGMEILKKIFKGCYRKTYVSFGQKKSFSVIMDNSQPKEKYLNVNKFKSARWIAEMAKLCDSKGIKFILIEIPGIIATQNVSDIGPYNINFDNGASAILLNLGNREFCTFLDKDRDWSGMSHLNMYGAAKFTSELKNIVCIEEIIQ